jgi:hypothetical protein
MSIDRQYGKINFECDNCGDTIETESKDFDEAMSAMRADGWRSVRDDGAWKHYCKECKF